LKINRKEGQIIMKTIKVNNYKMEKIASRMTKKFGKIKRGEEDNYTMELFTIESNLIKTHRRYPDYKSRRAIEAINLFLLKIDVYLSNGIEYDFSGQLKDGNKVFLEALQMSCDPFYNEELKTALSKDIDLEDRETREKIFEIPVKCLLRIKKSVEMWIRELGNYGYFKFLEEQMGSQIKGEELDYTIRLN
jgi:hypothetical protein